MRDRLPASFGRNGGPLLFLVGLGMTVAAILEDTTELAVALVGAATVLLGLSVLLPRLRGSFRLSAGGLEGELAEVVDQVAAEEHVPREAVIVALIDEAVQKRVKSLASDAARAEMERRDMRREAIRQIVKQARETDIAMPITPAGGGQQETGGGASSDVE